VGRQGAGRGAAAQDQEAVGTAAGPPWFRRESGTRATSKRGRAGGGRTKTDGGQKSTDERETFDETGDGVCE